jgi:uncharacterized protein (TIGR03435 family)
MNAQTDFAIRRVETDVTAGGPRVADVSVDDHREVRDHTGLAGNFEVTIEWTPSQMPQRVPDGLVLPPIDPNGPSLFTAIQEQLGPKLEPEKDQSDVLVIDHAEQPTAD